MSSCDNDKKCYVCKSNNLEQTSLTLSDATSDSNIIICQDCGYARRYGEIDFEENIKTQQEVFDKSAKIPKLKPRWPNRPKLVALKAKKLTKGKKRILDIGCGVGGWLSCFGKEWEKFGVEVSSVTAQVAREFAEANVFCGPIEEYDCEPDYFDLITAFALIEHITDPRYLLEWAYKHLKQGGLFILMTGDRESKVAQKLGVNWLLYKPLEHVSFFTARSLRRLVEDAGFRVINEEWRCACYVSNSFLYRNFAKIKEILSMVNSPKYSHYYIYARKC